jgi:hypothetical protein
MSLLTKFNYVPLRDSTGRKCTFLIKQIEGKQKCLRRILNERTLYPQGSEECQKVEMKWQKQLVRVIDLISVVQYMSKEDDGGLKELLLVCQKHETNKTHLELLFNNFHIQINFSPLPPRYLPSCNLPRNEKRMNLLYSHKK